MPSVAWTLQVVHYDKSQRYNAHYDYFQVRLIFRLVSHGAAASCPQNVILAIANEEVVVHGNDGGRTPSGRDVCVCVQASFLASPLMQEGLPGFETRMGTQVRTFGFL